MTRLFGTDGVRGTANVELTAELALDLAVAAAHVLGEAGALQSGGRPFAIVGRDPRASGEFLEAAVVAGLASAGIDVKLTGVVPTPAVAYLVDELDADLGVMISASHNAMPDNGIKFFSRGGVKLDDYLEDAIEVRMGEEWERPTGAGVGRVTSDHAAVDAYVDHLVRSLGDARLDGLKVVLDCAHGAASETAVAAFTAAGADVTPINNTPDGININDNAGSTHMDGLLAKVAELGADMGIALDGDADRCLAADANGNLVDGDKILAILAVAMKEQHRLHADTLVATIMSNLGLINAMREHGIRVDQTKVGDRYVLESMNANGFALGGEQSGHVIINDFANTGDGTLTGLHLAARMATTGKTLEELASVMTVMPQVLINVRGVDKLRAGIDNDVNQAVSAAAQRLGDQGRVLLRPSGTEPVVRVMVEAPTTELAQEIAEGLAAVVSERLSL